jgi:hypothetical protein
MKSFPNIIPFDRYRPLGEYSQALEPDPPPIKKEAPDTVTAEIRGGGLQELSARTNRFAKARAQALVIADYMGDTVGEQHRTERLKFEKAIKLIGSCGNYLLFRDYYTVDIVRLHAGYFCQNHLLCPLCAIRRAVKVVQAYWERYMLIMAANPHLKPYMITLTVKDGDDLLERFWHLRSAVQFLFNQRRHHRGSIFDCIAGAVWSYEIKRGSGSNLWHPHLHMIALVETPPCKYALRDEWLRITGDSKIVDVQPMYGKNGGDLMSGFLEVFKYAVKFSAQPPADTVHCWQMLRGSRLISSAGLFRGVVVPDSLLDDPIDDLPYLEYFYRYVNGEYRQPIGERVPMPRLVAA